MALSDLVAVLGQTLDQLALRERVAALLLIHRLGVHHALGTLDPEQLAAVVVLAKVPPASSLPTARVGTGHRRRGSATRRSLHRARAGSAGGYCHRRRWCSAAPPAAG